MAKRLQVILQDPDYREVQRAARAQNVTIAAWVRQALLAARKQEPQGNLRRKLDAVKSAARFAYPTGDIESMLAQIEQGYGVADRR